MPTLGDQGDIGLYGFLQYVIGMRPEIGIQKSIHVGFATVESSYRIISRLDGQGKWNGAVTPATGSTLTWAVVIAARA